MQHCVQWHNFTEAKVMGVGNLRYKEVPGHIVLCDKPVCIGSCSALHSTDRTYASESCFYTMTLFSSLLKYPLHGYTIATVIIRNPYMYHVLR